MNLLVIDDHLLFREGLRHILQRLDDTVTIHEFGAMQPALRFADEMSDFDLILMDMQLPDAAGLEGLQALRRTFPGSPIALISGVADPAQIQLGLRQGAQGFISKSGSADDLLNAIERILAGHVESPSSQMPITVNTLPSRSAFHLTPRQVEVLSQLCEGHSNKEIGRTLNMSENTVRCHVASVFRALGAKSRTEAVVLARRRGFV